MVFGVGVEIVKLVDVINIVGLVEILENSCLLLYDIVMVLVLNFVEGILIEGVLLDM